MLTFLRITNVALIIAMIGCVAGALAGLIVLLPVVAGAWGLNLAALVGYEEAARPGWIERVKSPPASAPERSHALAAANGSRPGSSSPGRAASRDASHADAAAA